MPLLMHSSVNQRNHVKPTAECEMCCHCANIQKRSSILLLVISRLQLIWLWSAFTIRDIASFVALHFLCVYFNSNFYSSADFIPTLRTLLGHPVYLIYLCVTIIQLNSLIGMVTYKPKYIEQHFRQSASKANFLMGMYMCPEYRTV